ncbi:hypothetical protein PoB_002228800 [Plakobranchus ocellatus]|uniref:Uncharacterized protein n=1 Tax=Plakobranchus ocellatus TaxID=259542 RepID=A0AAV3ZMU6_9GAST|nr:hypothetical protein PoB_002228800 [Plakobranchus ocellatus]
MMRHFFGFYIQPVHNKVISGFQALRQARAPMAGLEPAIEGSLQSSDSLATVPPTPHPHDETFLEKNHIKIMRPSTFSLLSTYLSSYSSAFSSTSSSYSTFS